MLRTYLIYVYLAMFLTVGDALRGSMKLHSDVTNIGDDYDTYTKHVRQRKRLNSEESLLSEHVRNRRSNSQLHCDEWSPWTSHHTPSASDKGDFEKPTDAEIEAFCSYQLGGTISEFRCKDEKGEPVEGVVKAPNGNYILDCADAYAGANCTVLQGSGSNDPCPDYSTQFKCKCGPPPVVTTTTSTTVQTTTPTTTVQTTSTQQSLDGSENAETGGVRTVNVCGLSIGWWILVLAIAILLSIINLLTTVILHKRVIRQQNRNHSLHGKVLPMRRMFHDDHHF